MALTEKHVIFGPKVLWSYLFVAHKLYYFTWKIVYLQTKKEWEYYIFQLFLKWVKLLIIYWKDNLWNQPHTYTVQKEWATIPDSV